MPGIARVLVLLLTLEGCVYLRADLHQSGASTRPTTNAHHRKKIRRRALIAAPFEVVGGLVCVAIAIAASQPSDAMSIGGQIDDEGKQLLARFMFLGGGAALIGSGLGDAVLGTFDPQW